MPFSLADVVPWGRSLDEYRDMFALCGDDLGKPILGCADGPASFNAELTALGGTVVSVDPVYRFDARAIRQRISETRKLIVDQVRENVCQFVWTRFGTVEELERCRMRAMERFLDDFDSAEGRYVGAAMPDLPFADGRFELALCSHFLFLYADRLSTGFHLLMLGPTPERCFALHGNQP